MRFLNNLRGAKSAGSIASLAQIYGIGSVANEREVLDLYRTSAAIYAIINYRAENVSSVKMNVVDKDGKVIENHPLMPALAPSASYNQMIKKVEGSLALVGNALILPNPNMLGQFEKGTKNLLAVNPANYTVYANSEGIERIDVDDPASRAEGKERRSYTPEQAMYLYSMSFDSDEFDGVAPAEAAFYAAAGNREMQATQFNYFKNRMLNALFFQPSQDTVQRENNGTLQRSAKALKDFINRMGIGSANAGRTSVLQDRWEVLDVQGDFTKLIVSELSASQKEDISIAFQFPITLLTFKDSNYAQSKEAVKFWRESWLVPHCNWIASQLSSFFSEWYGYEIIIKPDFSEVIGEDEKEKIELATMKRDAGYIDQYTSALEAGVENPSPMLKGLYMVDGVLVPESELPNIWRYKIAVAPSVFNAGIVPGVPDIDPQSMQDKSMDASKDADAKTLFLALMFPNQPDLIGLQSRVKAMVGEGVNWESPDEFHITLAYAPSVTDEQLEAVKLRLGEIEVPEMALAVGSLKAFDNVGEHALHFRIRHNEDLHELQESVYDILNEAGVQTSAYSIPSQWIPHITMGYSPQKVKAVTFNGKLRVTPQSFVAKNKDETLYEWNIAEGAEVEIENGEIPDVTIPDEAFKELMIALRKASKSQAFTCVHIPEATYEHVRSLVEYGAEEADVLRSAKWHYSSVKGAKAMSDTRAKFFAQMARQLRSAVDEKQGKALFIRNVLIILDRYTRLAYLDGYADAGIKDYELEEEDVAWLNNYVSEQETYVKNLANVLYSDDVLTEDEIQGKPQMWWNMSVMGAYNHALTLGSKNGLGVFVQGATSDKCIDCVALKGQIRRYSTWNKYFDGQLPPSRKTACSGFRCLCAIKPTFGKKTRGNLPPLHGH